MNSPPDSFPSKLPILSPGAHVDEQGGVDSTSEDQCFALPSEPKPSIDSIGDLVCNAIVWDQNQVLSTIRQSHERRLCPVLPELAPKDHGHAVVDVEMNSRDMRPTRGFVARDMKSHQACRELYSVWSVLHAGVG